MTAMSVHPNQTANPTIKMANGTVIVPDAWIDNQSFDQYDALVMPGGMDAANTFKGSQQVQQLIKSFHQSGKLVTAICASPIAFSTGIIGNGFKLTSHPCTKSELNQFEYLEERVVHDESKKIITSRGPGTAMEFALEIVKTLCGESVCESVARPLVK